MFSKGILLVLTILGLEAVHAIPQASTPTPTLATITLLGVNPPGFIVPSQDSSLSMFFHASVTYDIVGVSSGSDGSETTISEGAFLSVDSPTTITSAGATITTIASNPYWVETDYATIIESSGGMKMSVSDYISFDAAYTVGEYESCTFGSDGTGGCYEEDQNIEESLSGSLTATSTGTFTTSFSGSITTLGYVTATLPLTLAAPASQTSSSNGAVGGKHVRGGLGEGSRGVGWFMGVVLPFALVFAMSF